MARLGAGSFLGAEVHGQTLGIIGFGRIGQAVAARAEGFAMRVIHTPRLTGPRRIDALLGEADFVSVHTPLTPTTRHLIDAAALSRMKPTAILINTARGEIVDQAALVDALREGEIAGAALDVTDPEPPPQNDPLLTAPNLILTPHIGSATRAARERMADLAVDNLLAGLDGKRCRTKSRSRSRSESRRRRHRHELDPAVDRRCRELTGDHGTPPALDRHKAGRRRRRERAAQRRRYGARLRVVAEYHALIDQYQVGRAVAIFTSAVRDSANGPEFARTLGDRYGLEPHVLKGDDEARLTYLGDERPRPRESTRTLVVDIGGGSTELVIGAQGELTFHVSTQAGVVRQTERHIHADPPTPGEQWELAEDVARVLAAAVPEDQRRVAEHAIAVAGTATSLAAIAQGLDPYDPAKVHGYVMTREECSRILERLAAIPLEERRHTKGLDPARAPTIVAGIIILLQVLDLFGLEKLEISENDILRGAAVNFAA